MGKRKREYYVTMPVIRATGEQCFTVQASSEEEAVQLVEQGNGQFDSEEWQVVEFGTGEAVLNE